MKKANKVNESKAQKLKITLSIYIHTSKENVSFKPTNEQ